MILEFSCKNFKSIGDKVSFSMLAGTDKSLEENVTNFNDIHVLKEAVIYGANGSGKSNFIMALAFLQKMVQDSHQMKLSQPIVTFPNKLKLSEATEYQIKFISDNIRYSYGVSFNSEKIKQEFLYYYPNNRASKIFERDEKEITYGEMFKKELAGVTKDFLKDNRLMLSCAANYRNIDEIMSAYVFFANQIVMYNDKTDWQLYSANQISTNDKLKEIFVKFLKGTGKTDLKDISSKIEQVQLESAGLPPIFNAEIQKIINSQTAQSSDVKFLYNDYELNLLDESTGVQKLFNIFFPFIDIILKNKILICDEFETHLHPLIVKELLELFKLNSKSSQLIFTTHDVNLLNLKYFRRDQIWFTEQKEHGFTDLYSLAELKSVRNNENITRNYLLGKYSGVPIINEKVKNELLEGIVEQE